MINMSEIQKIKNNVKTDIHILPAGKIINNGAIVGSIDSQVAKTVEEVNITPMPTETETVTVEPVPTNVENQLASVSPQAPLENAERSFNGTPLQYDAAYEVSDVRLTKRAGRINFDNHQETYYSEKVLPGGGLDIPGRHVAQDGTIRDELGYICVAANESYLPKGSTVMTSLGPAKVYDTGPEVGVVDIYVSW